MKLSCFGKTLIRLNSLICGGLLLFLFLHRHFTGLIEGISSRLVKMVINNLSKENLNLKIKELTLSIYCVLIAEYGLLKN